MNDPYNDIPGGVEPAYPDYEIWRGADTGQIRVRISASFKTIREWVPEGWMIDEDAEIEVIQSTMIVPIMKTPAWFRSA